MANIHIPDSYKVSKFRFRKVLATFTDAEAMEVKAHRSEYSLLCEWVVHSFLAHWGIAVARTKDVDLDWPCDKPEWVYIVLGTVLWIFIP